MPELPEVEVIRRGLRSLVRGKVFAAPRIFTPKTVAYPEPELFARRLTGRRVEELGRQGKFLLFFLDRGELVFHLRMTGRLVYLPEKAPLPHDGTLRLFLPFADGSGLFFGDLRKFGRVWLFQQKEERVHARLQQAPISANRWTKPIPGPVRQRSVARPCPGSALCGQAGNIVDESLFRCGLHPRSGWRIERRRAAGYAGPSRPGKASAGGPAPGTTGARVTRAASRSGSGLRPPGPALPLRLHHPAHKGCRPGRYYTRLPGKGNWQAQLSPR